MAEKKNLCAMIPAELHARVLAFQISEELMQRIKDYLDAESAGTGRKISRKEFIIGLIEDALEAAQTESA